MGQIHKPNLSLSIELIAGVKKAIIEDIKVIRDEREIFNLIVFGTTLSFRTWYLCG